MTAPEIPDTQSPYWLRLYGHWIPIDGIQPENEVSPGRAYSELLTVDGYRYVQRAPRGPRSWKLLYDHATAAATAALESAAYDFSTTTLFLDTNDASVNMLPPDLLTTWSAYAGPIRIMNVGSVANPLWISGYGQAEQGVDFNSINVLVRGGVTYTIALWYTTPASAGEPVLQVSGEASGSVAGLAGATEAAPFQAVLTVTPADDGVITVEALFGYTAALMVYEGDCEPEYYRAGRRMPCQVSVQDTTMQVNPVWQPRACDPCALPRETSDWTIQEVGVDPFTPMDAESA
jgi:hypothetical protein